MLLSSSCHDCGWATAILKFAHWMLKDKRIINISEQMLSAERNYGRVGLDIENDDINKVITIYLKTSSISS